MNSNPRSYLPCLFEKASSNTWERLKASLDLNISQSETTITDNILLDLKAAKCHFLQIIKTPQKRESLQGTDWEWWIGADNVGWLRYAVQAKKIDLKSRKYESLAHKVNNKLTKTKELQFSILERYARANDALARYCFYNYTDSVNRRTHWHCNLPFDPIQLGCSIATLSTVYRAINYYGCRNFDFIHSKPSTLPLRCLVTCPIILSLYAGVRVFPVGFEDYNEARLFPDLPSNIRQALEAGYFEEWDGNFYNNDVQAYPKRILVAELPYWSNRPQDDDYMIFP